MHRIINYLPFTQQNYLLNKNICHYGQKIFTFHPDGDVGATIVAPRALGGKEVASRRLEPVQNYLPLAWTKLFAIINKNIYLYQSSTRSLSQTGGPVPTLRWWLKLLWGWPAITWWLPSLHGSLAGINLKLVNIF